jgi:hypothetical protein
VHFRNIIKFCIDIKRNIYTRFLTEAASRNQQYTGSSFFFAFFGVFLTPFQGFVFKALQSDSDEYLEEKRKGRTSKKPESPVQSG